MVFPQTPLPIKGEMLIDGSWVTMTSDIRLDESISIVRGRTSEQGRIGATKCNFKLNNRDGRYSNRNPMSPYYKLLPLNTLFRVSVTGTTTFMDVRDSKFGAYDSNVDPVYSSAPRAYTSDKAALDITGDIDVRIDIEPDYWNPDNTRGVTLCGKYRNTASNNRSWALTLNTRGFPRLYWSEDGTNIIGVSGSTVDHMMPRDKSRRALRATLDVNNGSGGYTVRFYVADTINDSWTQLGTDIVVSGGTTSIFSGNARLEVGSADDGDESELNGNNVFNNYDSFVGKVYGCQVRDGIGGTLVANFDPTSRSAGDTSWSDGLGNTWTLVAPAEITADNRRFIGEMSALPQYWDNTGNDIYIRTTASGIIRRLTQGAKVLKSPVYRNISQYGGIGYWPMEDGVQATRASSAIKGSSSAYTADVTFGFDETFPGSEGVVRLNSSASRIRGNTKVAASTDYSTLIIYFKYPDIPAVDETLIEFYSTGTLKRWTIEATAGGGYRLRGYNGSKTKIVDELYGSGTAPPNEWTAMRFQLSKNGGSVDTDWEWYGILDPNYSLAGTVTYSGTVGRITGFQIRGSATNADLAIAHLHVGQVSRTINETSFLQSTNAYVGEAAGVRFRRLCREERVPFEIIGDPNATEPMGPQGIDILMNLLYDTGDVDGGYVYESRYMAGLGFRSRNSLYNQQQLELDYAANHLTGQFLPTDDDQNIRNRVIASRPFGGSAVDEVTEGPYSTQEPPDGVGVYEVPVQLNASSDERLEALAQHQTMLGTWDELRYPSVQVNLERQPFTDDASLFAGIVLLEIGSPILVTNMPSWLPPDDVSLLIQGYRETLSNRGWEFVWNTTPYGPYIVNDLTQSARSVFRAAATNSTLNAGINSTANSFVVHTPTGAPWINSASKPASFPVDIIIDGEAMQVGAITARSSNNQTFSSVTRSTNGVVKSHNAGAEVQVLKPFRAAL